MAKTDKENIHAQILKDSKKAAKPQKESGQGRRALIAAGAAALILIAAIVISMVMNSQKRAAINEGPAPSYASSTGGFKLTSTTAMEDMEGPAEVDASSIEVPTTLPPEDQPSVAPEGVAKAPAGEPMQMVVYADANCVHCAKFEQSYGDLINEKLNNGEITVEYRITNFLDANSPTMYSSRAANALAAVAEKKPEAYMEYLAAIYDRYGTEPNNEELISMANDLGVDIRSEVENKTYYGFVNYTSNTARNQQVAGTPTVWLDGEDWAESDTPTLPDFFAKKAAERTE